MFFLCSFEIMEYLFPLASPAGGDNAVLNYLGNRQFTEEEAKLVEEEGGGEKRMMIRYVVIVC